MCGITGYVGERDAAPILIEGLAHGRKQGSSGGQPEAAGTLEDLPDRIGARCARGAVHVGERTHSEPAQIEGVRLGLGEVGARSDDERASAENGSSQPEVKVVAVDDGALDVEAVVLARNVLERRDERQAQQKLAHVARAHQVECGKTAFTFAGDSFTCPASQ